MQPLAEAQRESLTHAIGLLILRLGVGGYMLTHGIGKLRMLLDGDFAKFGDPIQIGSAPSLVLWCWPSSAHRCW